MRLMPHKNGFYLGWIVILLLIPGSYSSVSHSKVRTLLTTKMGSPRLQITGVGETGIQPKSVKVSPDGKKVYVANFGRPHVDNVTVYDADTLGRVGAVSFKGNAVEMTFSPDAKTLYVSNFRRSVIEVIDVETLTLRGEVSVGEHPKTMVVSPDGSKLYVGNWSNDSISLVDTQRLKELKRIRTGSRPRGMVLTDDKLIVAGFWSNRLYEYDPETLDEIHRYYVCVNPRHLVLSPDKKTVYFSCSTNDAVHWHDVATRKKLGMAPVGRNPRTIDISSDGRWIAVADFDGSTVSLLDMHTLTHRTNKVKGAKEVVGLAMAPTQTDPKIFITSWRTRSVIALEPRSPVSLSSQQKAFESKLTSAGGLGAQPEVWANSSVLVAKAVKETAVETAAVEVKGAAAKGAEQAPGKTYFSKSVEASNEPLTVTPKKGNSVVVVVVDALNAAHLGAYGYSRNTSPNIDKLAQDGVVFTNWTSNSSWTRPSFTTLLTGVPKSVHNIELDENKLNKKIVTLASAFKSAGYQTAGFVGNPLVAKHWGFDQGFDTYLDAGDFGAFPRAEKIVDSAIKWLGEHKDQPFLMVLFLTDPHTPYQPPPGFQGYLNKMGIKKHIAYPKKEYADGLSQAAHQGIVAAYDGEVAYTDAQIGRLMKALSGDKRGQNATIVVTADHGEVFGKDDCYQHAYHMWEPVLRVPFILKSNAVEQVGVVDNSKRTHVDFFAILTELSDINLPANKMGVSLTHGNDSKRAIYSQYNAKGIRRQVVKKNGYKLVYHHKVDKAVLSRLEGTADLTQLKSLAFEGEKFQLFNLNLDPFETEDIYESNRNSPLVRSLKAKLLPAVDAKKKPKQSLKQKRTIAKIKKTKNHKTSKTNKIVSKKVNTKETNNTGKVETTKVKLKQPSANQSRTKPNKAPPALSKETLDALKAAGYIQ